MFDFIVIVVILALAVTTNMRVASRMKDGKKRNRELNALLAYHMLFVLLFTAYILAFGGDSTGYWRYSFQQLGGVKSSMFDYYGLSTTFPLFLNYIPSRVLGLSYFTGNVIYGFLGFIGIRFLYVLYCRSITVNVKLWGVKIIPALFFLPNLHFWTAGISKDTLCFIAIAWFLHGFQHYKKSFFSLFFSFLLLFHTRPHIGAVLIISAILALLFTNKVKMFYKILFTAIIFTGFVLIFSKLTAFLKIDEVSVESLEGFANNRINQLNHASVGSAIDLASYPIPYRFFTFLYRPLFFDAHNVVSFFSSFENLIYLCLTFMGMRAFKFRYFKALPLWLLAGGWFFIFTSVIFANSLSNLGIIMRMKNMSMIYLVFFCTWLININRYNMLKKAAKRKQLSKSTAASQVPVVDSANIK